MRRVLITAVALLALAPAGAVAWQGVDGDAASQDDGFSTGSDVVRVYRGTVVSLGQDGSIVADVRTRACPGRDASVGPEGLPGSPAGTTTESHRGPGGGFGESSETSDDGAAGQQYGGSEDRGGRGPRDRGRGRPARLLN